MASVKQMSDFMYADFNEMEHALQGFGGPNDTCFNNANELVKTIKKKAR